MKALLLTVFMLLFAPAGWSAVEIVKFDDPQHEQRYKTLIEELRCLVCQNQNIASSNADLAKDLRQQVYQRIINGETDQQIIDFMVARYGEFVLYRPPLNSTTGVLWIAPFVLLVAGIVIVLLIVRRGGKQNPPAAPPGDLEQARKILQDRET